MGLSIRAYAQRRGVSHTAVAKALKTGRIGLEADGTIDPLKADAQWTRNTLPSQKLNASKAATAPVSTPVAAPDYQTSRAMREAYAARLTKLDFEERAGKLLDADAVKAKHFTLARLLRDRLQQIPRKLAPEIVASVVEKPDQRAVEDLLMAAIREALMELTQ